jgi:hypothetical protein
MFSALVHYWKINIDMRVMYTPFNNLTNLECMITYII